MKKLALGIATTTAILFAPQTFAQAQAFKGFSVAAGLNATNSSVEHGNAVSGNDSNFDVQAQYAFAVGEKFVLGLGASAGLSDYKVAANAKMKSTNSFFVTPGYAVSNNLLAYGKLGTISGSFAIDPSPTINMTGTAYGGGVKRLFGKNFFGQAEVVFNQYDDKVSSASLNAKAKATFFSVGIGYQF